MNKRQAASARYPELCQIIGGELEQGLGKAVDVMDPTTGCVLGQYREASESQIDRAVDASERGFATWRKMSAHDRGTILHRVATELRDRSEELAELVVLELGKPWKDALAEVEQAAGMWQWAAEEGRRAYGRIIPSREHNSIQFTLVEPLGPIAAFGSWNAPLITPSRKISSALGAGCSIIAKAAEDVPACSLEIGKIAYKCGLPEGVLSVLVGDPVMISEKLIESSVIRGVTFTGSTHVGKMLASKVVSYMKRPIMELGGHAPVLVFNDVDVEKVAREGARAKFRNAGQVCTSPTRFFVQSGIFEEFTSIFADEASNLNLGCGFDRDTTMGPLVAIRRLAAMDEFIINARSLGFSIPAGGRAISGEGYFYEPTVISGATTEGLISNVEPFGPIAMTASFNTYKEGVALANRLPFALAAYVHCNNVHVINSAMNDVEAGNVICNGWRVSLPETPFGGHKDSGFYSEGGIEGLFAFQKIKFAYSA